MRTEPRPALLLGCLSAAIVLSAAGCSDDEPGGGAAAGGGGSTTGATSTTSAPATGGGAGGADGAGGDGGATGGTGGDGGGNASGGGAGGDATTGAGGAPSEIEGYWVWTRTIEDGELTLEITDEDMEPKVGPSGWEGCPEGILCTRYGIHKVAFGASGRFHQQRNVKTSSDFQTLGTWDGGAEVTAFERQEQFSCAHPDSVNANVVPGAFQHRLEAGELWISVSGFGNFPFVDPEDEPTRWIVYKPVSREDYYGRYEIRVCQEFDDHTCHEACFDDSLVDEP